MNHCPMSKNTFASIKTLGEFLRSEGLNRSDLGVSQTSNGSIVLTALGGVVATIKNDLKGHNAAATAKNLSAVNLCFGIPHPGSKDNSGRPSLPCVMESSTEWDVVSLF